MAETTYRAVEVTTPGTLNLVQRPIPLPGRGQVRIRVEACGVCHSDAATVEGFFPGISYPRVPGHEIAGYIEALGEDVNNWKIGQRVGVGWFGGECGKCESCRRGDFVTCKDLIVSGVAVDGGWAEVVIAEQRALAAIPEDLASDVAAPLLCAGVTTFNALRNSGLRSGDTVAIHGVGGLGHLAIQFGRRMGFRIVAIARGNDKAEMAFQLGAHLYVDSDAEDVAAALQRLGGAEAILSTASNSKAIGSLLGGLKSRGKLILVGVPPEPIEFNAIQLVLGSRSISGQQVGTAIDEEDTLKFSVEQVVVPMIEVVPLEQAPTAYRKMMEGNARFRMVLSMN